MSKFRGSCFLWLGLIFVLLPVSTSAGENRGKRAKKLSKEIKLIVAPWGPTQKETDAAKARAEKSEAVQNLLKGAKYRLLEFSFLETADKSGASRPPTRFRAAFYDYTNDRAIIAESDFAATTPVTVREEFYQPTPNDEEFDEAIQILQTDAKLGAVVKSGALKAFRPMPDVSILDGTTERLVNVGLSSPDDAERSEVVSVSIKRGVVIRYESGAPASSSAAPENCGIADAGQATTSNGTAGQANLTVLVNNVTLWEMLVIRPSASSGTRKSGIEVRDVKFKGKSVLKRGHAPVLNVQYTPQTCGPYRDWQWQEDMFQAPDAGSQDVAPGIRVLASGQFATTALESGNDTGNFRGVAIYFQNNEAVLVSEMQAGWYRYIMEWRFANDGTIRPRYGFGATKNNCVCNVHNHHIYWRFDFDIVQPNNKVFQIERGRKFMRPLATEATLLRNYQTNRGLVVQNANGDEAYQLTPNLSDGVTDTFGVSDLWVLRYKLVVGGTPLQNEIDDGFNQTTSQNAFIQINPFLNNESVDNQDVVVWYGAHFIHADAGNVQLNPDRSGLVLSGDHVVGPDIRPIRW
jgi:hypothetical protein